DVRGKRGGRLAQTNDADSVKQDDGARRRARDLAALDEDRRRGITLEPMFEVLEERAVGSRNDDEITTIHRHLVRSRRRTRRHSSNDRARGQTKNFALSATSAPRAQRTPVRASRRRRRTIPPRATD